VVVGLPGAVDLASAFDDFGRAGGRPNPATGGAYYTGASAVEIEATVTAIFGGLGARCEAALASPPLNSDLTHVTAGCELLTGAELRPDTTGAASRVILEGDVCGALARDAPPPVNVLWGCASPP
jgi:hypothetical protein